MKILAVDVDQTLSDVSDRLKYLEESPKNWKMFFDESIHDKPHQKIIDHIHTFKPCDLIYITTARNRNVKHITERWLKSINFHYDHILMRDNRDFRKDYLVKEDMFNLIKEKHGFYPHAVFDDNEGILDLASRLNIHTIVDAKLFW